MPSQSTDIRVVTMARNEGDMLRRWIDYYAAQFGPQNLLVLDDSSDDGSTDTLQVGRIQLSSEVGGADGFDVLRTRFVNRLTAALLVYSDVVIYVDVDEFLIADPTRYSGLRGFLQANDEEVLAPVGLNLVHNVYTEQPLRPELPLLSQRKFAKFAPRYCKPAIKRIAKNWGPGFHSIEAPYRVHPDLFLVHAKWFDRDEALRRQTPRHARMLADGAGKASAWRIPPDRIERRFEEWCDPDVYGEGTPLDVRTLDLDGVVTLGPAGVRYRSGEPGPGSAMTSPLLRLDERFTAVL